MTIPGGDPQPQLFDARPEEFYRFYREKMLCLDAQPNPAHRKLAELEAAGKLTSVVTQNIDGLHQRAGSRRVWELHGSVHRNHCMRCGRAYPVEFVRDSGGVPRCACGGIVKPDVVLYEEQLDGHTCRGLFRTSRGRICSSSAALHWRCTPPPAW